MTDTPDSLPRWDLTPIFPALGSTEYSEAFARVEQQVASLAALFDEKGVRRTPNGSPDPTLFEMIVRQLNEVLEGMRVLTSFVGCLASTDARDSAARAQESLLDNLNITLGRLRSRLTAWIGSIDIDGLMASSEEAKRLQFFLRKSSTLASHQMSEEAEALALEVQPAGLLGWAKLHGDMSALLTAETTVDGETKSLPIASIRSLAYHKDRETRRSAYEAELGAWETVSVPMAAALNGIKGFQLALRRRRGWEDDIQPTLLSNSIDLQVLQAMQEACEESFPDFGSYLKSKAAVLGLPKAAWYDMNAPVGDEARRWSWTDASEFVVEQFASYSSRMAEFAERAFRERWIDAEPRVGKQGGAYCTGVFPGVSRVMMNFGGSTTDVSTLAHELGHAYHNLNMEKRTPLQRSTPATLAETASIFCETIAFEAALRSAPAPERLGLLDTTLQRNLMVVVDIHSRFLFEREVFRRRGERELSSEEFCEVMLVAQRQTYGNALD
ncbi:MAG TPA: M3 family metallopeptidase, partial [Chthonomonadales bacterium]|nr:M3 family metallopeptidase [Chthonomonadales bacterium]